MHTSRATQERKKRAKQLYQEREEIEFIFTEKTRKRKVSQKDKTARGEKE